MFAPRALAVCLTTILCPLVLAAPAAQSPAAQSPAPQSPAPQSPAPQSPATGAASVDPQASWSGKNPDASLRELAPESGLITEADSWKKLWDAWRPDEAVPKVDFDRELILVGTAPGPNLVMMQPGIDEQGNVRFSVGATKMAGPGFGYKLIKIDREGVKRVNGTEVSAGAEDSITVTVVGTLRTGIFAIGGETTGTTITAKGITWELDFGDQATFRQAAEGLDGKQVVVKGSLQRRSGVEIEQRWIVNVTDFGAAAPGRRNPAGAARQ